MKKLKKSAGFFLIELLIVLVIIGILVLVLMPSYQNYLARTKFTNVILKAESLKAAVGACVMLNNNSLIGCSAGGTLPGGAPSGIPSSAPIPASYIQSWTVVNGVVQVNSTTIGLNNTTLSYSYIMTPTITSTGDITWAVSGTCIAAGLC